MAYLTQTGGTLNKYFPGITKKQKALSNKVQKSHLAGFFKLWEIIPFQNRYRIKAYITTKEDIK